MFALNKYYHYCNSVLVFIFGIIISMQLFAQTTPASNSSNNNYYPQKSSPRIIIDATSLVQPNQAPTKTPPKVPDTNRTNSTENLRIGSQGQYFDSNSGKSTQYQSNGQICESNLTTKKCN